MKSHAILPALPHYHKSHIEIYHVLKVHEYLPEQFDKMIEETKPDALIVACMDCFHVDYLLKGLERGLDVICEKPMCTNVEDVLRVVESEKKSSGKVICTFNYRYNPVGIPAIFRSVTEAEKQHGTVSSKR